MTHSLPWCWKGPMRQHITRIDNVPKTSFSVQVTYTNSKQNKFSLPLLFFLTSTCDSMLVSHDQFLSLRFTNMLLPIDIWYSCEKEARECSRCVDRIKKKILKTKSYLILCLHMHQLDKFSRILLHSYPWGWLHNANRYDAELLGRDNTMITIFKYLLRTELA